MKKIISAFILCAMLLSCAVLPVLADDNTEGFIATHNLEGLTGNYNSSLTKSDTGTVNMDGNKSLLIKTDRKTYTLNGNPDEFEEVNGEQVSKCQPEKWHKSRRTKLASFADNKTIPAGEYYISVWVYTANGDNVQNTLENLGNEDHKHEIAISLHTASETDDSLGQNHEDAVAMVKLFKKSTDTRPEMTRSGKQQTSGTRVWEEFTAKITTTEEYSQFSFWLIGTADEGENATISTYLDSFSVYNEATNSELEDDALPKAKSDAFEKLDAYNSENASDTLKAIVADAKNRIEAATAVAEVSEILIAALEAAKAQDALDALNLKKSEAKADLDKLVGDNPSAAVLALLEEGKNNIDKAENADGILAAKNNAKQAINAQLKAEKPAETEPVTEADTTPDNSNGTTDGTSEEKKGCGASVAATAMLLPVLTLGAALLRRRED